VEETGSGGILVTMGKWSQGEMTLKMARPQQSRKAHLAPDRIMFRLRQERFLWMTMTDR